MYRRVSNNTKITHFHSLGHKSIILHCWPAPGSDVLPSATEKRVMARDAHHRELVSPTDTCDAHSRHGSISKAGLNFHLAPKHTIPLPMWVYGCKSLLTSRGGHIWVANAAEDQPLLCPPSLSCLLFPHPTARSREKLSPGALSQQTKKQAKPKPEDLLPEALIRIY